MHKIKKLLLFLLTFVIFFLFLKDITKKEALALAKPAINSILDYKKNFGKYPLDLSELKNFPYKIKKIDKNEYAMTKKEYNAYTIYYYPDNNIGQKTIFKIDFFDNKKVGAINVYFKDDGSYKIDFSAGSLGPGA